MRLSLQSSHWRSTMEERVVKRPLVALLAIVALVAGACAGDDSDDGTTGAGAAPASANADATTAPTETDPDAAPVAGAGTLDVDAVLAADLGDCAEPARGDPLVIGYAADLSETAGYADTAGSKAAAHYIDLINCTGGAGGVPVEFAVADVRGDPEAARRATADLLDAGAHVILGPPFADTGASVLQTVGASRAVIFVSSTEPVLPDPSIYSFLVTFDDTRQAEAAARFAIDQGFARAITFSAEGPYFGYNPEKFAAEFEELGGEVVLDQSYVPFEDFDFAVQADEVAQAADGSEVLYTAMTAPQLDALRGAIEERGVEIGYIGADSLGVSGITEIANNEGVYWTGHGLGESGNRFERLNDSLAAAGKPSRAPGFAALAADAVTVAVQGFLDAGSADPEEIARAIADLSGVDAVTGTLSYAGTDGVPDADVYILQIRNGEIALAAKV